MSPRRGVPKQKEKSRGVPKWAIVVGIGALVVVAAIALFTLQTPQAPAPVAPGSSSTSNTRTKGDPNAKLELIEWSDFQ